MSVYSPSTITKSTMALMKHHTPIPKRLFISSPGQQVVKKKLTHSQTLRQVGALIEPATMATLE